MKKTFGDEFNRAPDIAGYFRDPANTLFMAETATAFDPRTGRGTLRWKRHLLKPQISFNRSIPRLSPEEQAEFPSPGEFHPALPFKIDFITPRTVRLRFWADPLPPDNTPSPMLRRQSLPHCRTWKRAGNLRFSSGNARLHLKAAPWGITFTDRAGHELTRTFSLHDNVSMHKAAALPFSFVRRAVDQGRHLTAAFSLAPDEMLFGGGESFTRLNKRGQCLKLWTNDTHSALTREMYKPVPFFLSSRGYGIFIHTGAPVVADMGWSFDSVMSFSIGGPVGDLFFFIGTPAQVLSEYTALTGRSPRPPLWSFGLWMSRISYRSAREVRKVAARLRQHRLPCDVIHVDTDWFSRNWRCDWEWDKKRFPAPARFIAQLRKKGFHLSLWQLPYLSRENPLFPKAWRQGYLVKSTDGTLPSYHACIDFTNPSAVRWYRAKLRKLLGQGIGAIKVDFGEGAPLTGLFANGRSGWYEHNLYPLRYNRTVAAVTEKTTGHSLIWARSAWAGSQRYPVHWGGDAEASFSGMAATLRAGLSLGMCGFTFWSHDIGGFTPRTPEPVYRHWLPFGLFSSHSRCHGVPPTEPWEYSRGFVKSFREAVELRYRLLPYIYSQAVVSARHGYPLLRPLFLNFPSDPVSWFIEDQYLFGDRFLVAPLFSSARSRRVYVPPGVWIDFQTHRRYPGGQWHTIAGGPVPIILLVPAGSAIPCCAPAQYVDQLNWERIKLQVFGLAANDRATGVFCRPGKTPQSIRVAKLKTGFRVLFPRPVVTRHWTITHVPGL